MKAIKSTVFAALLFTSTAVLAQADSTQSKKQERYFKRYSVQIAGSGLRFIGSKDPDVEHSKTGYGGHILPAWNITDNHSLGFKMVWSYHNEQNISDNFSLLANYQFTYFGGPNDMPIREKDVFGLYAGLGIGFSNTTTQKDSVKEATSKNLFAMMPYVGIRYDHLYADAHFHLAAGNKDASYFGFSVGIIFGGGLRNKINEK
jgi:hypothetical protein